MINKRQSKGIMGKGEVRNRDRMRHEREEYIKRRQWVMWLEFLGNALVSAHQKLLIVAVWHTKIKSPA